MWKKTGPKGGRYITVVIGICQKQCLILKTGPWMLQTMEASNNENPNRSVITYTSQASCPVVRIGSPPPPHPQGSVALLPFGSWEGDTLACGEGGGGPNSDEGTDTLALYVFSTTYTIKGIVQPFELGGVTRLIRYAVKFCMAGNLKIFFLMIQTHERSLKLICAA